MPKILIDEKLFAHINNDAFLMGSVGLQGNLFANTMGYLDQYLAEFVRKGGSISKDVEQLLKACTQLTAYEKTIGELREGTSTLKPTAEDIQRRAIALTTDDYLLLPGGWIAEGGGHAMVYQLQKDADGDLLFSIHNSGSGLSYHAKRSGKEKELYNPILTYKIPKANIGRKDFIPFIEELLSAQIPRIHRRDKIGPDYLYEIILPKLSYLDGKIVKDKSGTEAAYTAGQLSGTCAQRSLHEMLKSRFKDLDGYRTFIYHFKAHALDEYMVQIRDDERIKNPKYQSQLEKAIRHQLRLLNLKKSTDPSKDLFTLREKEAQTSKLLGYLAEIHRLIPAPGTVVPPSPRDTAPVLTTCINLPKPETTEAAGLAAAYTPEDLEKVYELKGKASLLEEMDALILRCNTLYAQKNYHAMFEQLEHLFTTMPLPVPPLDTLSSALLPFYQAIDSEEKALEFYRKMNQLQGLYFESCDRLFDKSIILPRMHVVKLSIFAITGHMNMQYPLVGAGIEPYHSYVNGILFSLTKGNLNTAYLATDDPQLDNRIQQIRGLYKDCNQYCLEEKDIGPYYQAIIDTYPELKARLEGLYHDNYSKDNSKFQMAVRAAKWTSLEYLTRHMAELQKDETFKPLLCKFKQQEEIEGLYSFYTHRLHGVWEPQTAQLALYIPDATDKPQVASRLLKSQCGITMYGGIIKSKYDIAKTPAAMSLLRETTNSASVMIPSRPDNETQLIPANYALRWFPWSKRFASGFTKDEKAGIAKHQVGQQDLEDRELFHLRRVASTQIPLTLDYFNQHLERLSGHDIQVYIEANLFQHGLLQAQLTEKKSALFFLQFDAFIKNGLKYFKKKGGLCQESLFLIRLGYLVNQYAAKFNSTLYNNRLQTFYEELNGYLSYQTDPAIKASLHGYRFLSLTSTPQKTIESRKTFVDALTSYFYLLAHNNPDEHLDADSKFQFECAKHSFMRTLKSQATSISSELLLNVLRDIGIPIDGKKDVSITGSYPIFTVHSGEELLYTLNVEHGLVFQDNLAYRTTPLKILNHPVTHQFGLQNQASCFTSPDEKVFLLDQPPTKLRFIKKDDSYRIQKLWPNPAGQEEWYELTAVSKAQANHWQLTWTDKATNLPTIMTQREMLTWVSLENNTFLISDAANQMRYDGVADSTLGAVNTRHREMNLCKDDTWMHRRLQSFEIPSLVTVWKTPSDYAIHLDRYGLKLTGSASSSTILWSWEGSDYQLMEEAHVFAEGVAHLSFKHKEQEVCILAIQPFINSDKRSESSEYYQLCHDTEAKIPKKIMEGILGKDTPQLWQYSGSERFIVYKMDKGQPVPTTTEEALYLCYIYLGSNQPEKAWAVLEDCDKRLGGIAGTYEEIQYLHWIIEALPYSLKKKDSDASISNPPYVACKLKALSLLTQFSRLDKDIPFPDPVSDPQTVNGMYERHSIKQNKLFYKGINDHIYSLYSTLQSMRRELPAYYNLNDAETKSLLDHYHQHVPKAKDSPTAVGALGYEWVQLNLNVLRQEWANLETKSKVRELTFYELRRKDEIATFLRKHQGVAKLISKLEYRPIDLTLPTITISLVSLSAATQRIINKFGELVVQIPPNAIKQEAAINALAMDMSDETFLQYFSDYLQIIRSAAHPLHNQLLNFCKATLIAHRHVPLDKQPKNLPRFCNILYRLANNPYPSHVTTFDALVNYAKELPVVAIEIPQLVDDTSELMISAQALWESTPERTIPIRPTVLPTSATHRIEEWLSEDVKILRRDWQAIEALFNSGRGELALEGTDFSALSREEFQAGCVKYIALRDLQELATNKLHAADIRDRIATQSQERLRHLSISQEALQTQLMALANQGPDDPILKQQWVVDVASGKRKALDMNQLLTLYFHADINRYSIETGLTGEKVNQLHELLIQFVAQGLQRQHCERVNKQLRAVETATDEERPRALFLLAQAVFSENRVDVVEEPALSLFQYHENILLRPQQEEALKRLLTTTSEDHFDETIEKIIMGGGKSKVILPTLAQKKATGNNLVVIEVPRALLRTNYIDLKATSSRLFNQNAYLFEFNRDSDCSAARLEQLYNQLTEVMVNKQYMVTTGDAPQSLELKYLELVNTPPIVAGKNATEAKKITDAWQEQVLWAERLVLLFKHRADIIIDETHQGLLLKTKLNYTIGESSPISKNILRYSTDLYRFLSNVKIGTVTLHEALLKRNLLTDPKILDQAITELVQQLTNHKDSPLRRDIDQWLTSSTADITPLVRDYLLNKTTSIPEFILKASPELRERIAFYKEQVSHLLPFTFKRQQGEHYGPSKLASKSPAERMLAIPYFANNAPSERSRFGNYLESINYTIQSLLISGIPRDLLRILLADWMTQARNELYEGEARHIDDTVIAATFRGLFGERTPLLFSQIDLDDEAQLSMLHEHLRHNESLIFSVLESQVLPKIKTNNTILHSDAYSHVDLVRSCQGMSGTPWNHRTFHQRLHFSEESALGTDGYVLRAIQEQKPTIHGADFSNTSTFIDTLFSPYDAHAEVRTIIDINASFKGINNLTVATSIAAYIQAHKEKFSTPEPIKFVLFFNEKNELSALRVQEDVENQVPIVIGSSDPATIEARLGCGPAGRFTYYDQSHTVGADIKQAPKAKGLVLIDHQTHFQSFLQGSMRMRDLLEGNQTIDLVVPTTLRDTPLNTLTTMMVTNEQRQLQQDNFDAAQAKMTEVLRNDFMQRLLQIGGEDAAMKKHQFLNIVSQYFIELESTNFFERYGGLDESKPTEDILKDYQASLLSDWHRLLGIAHQAVTTAEETSIKDNIAEIIAQVSIPGACASHQITRKNTLATEVEVQQEQEIQVEVLTLKEMQQEMYDPEREGADYERWSVMDKEGFPLDYRKLDFKTLTSICATTGAKDIPEFSKDILASKNFYESYIGQEKFVGMYLKPVHALMFKKISGKLQCTLLTQQECEELSRVENPQFWISTTQHTLLVGEPPAGIRSDPTYQSIIEQVRFFNGEFNLLLHRDAPYSWLEEDSKKKLDFFAQYLWPCHETSAADVSSLTALFSINRKVFLSMAQAPWVDNRKVDWATRYPTCEQEAIRDFQSLADAFYEATRLWDTTLNGPDLSKKFNLSLAASGYLMRYVEQLWALNGALSLLDQQSNLAKYNGKQKGFLLTQLNTDLQKRLPGLCPELRPILENGSYNNIKQEYYYLTTLMNNVPMCKNHPAILRALAFNPLLNETHIDILMTMAIDDQRALYGLLNNSSVIVTPARFQELSGTKYTHDEKTILALANHRFLKEEQYVALMRRADTMTTAADVLLALLQHLDMSLSTLKEIIATNPLNDKQIEMILRRPVDAIDSAFFNMLVDAATTDKNFKSLVAHPLYKEVKASQLARMIEKSNDADIIQRSVFHGNADESVYLASAKNKATTLTSLVEIASKTQDSATIAAILAREDMQKASDDNDKILNALAENTHLIQLEQIKHIVMTANNESVLKNVLQHKNEFLDTELLSIITTKAVLDQKQLLIVATHPKATVDMLIDVATKALSSNIIKAILNRADMKHPGDDNDRILNALATNTHLTKTPLIKQIVSTTNKVSILNNILMLKNKYLNSKILSIVATKPGLSDEHRLIIAAHCKTTASTLKQLPLTNPLVKEAVLKNLLSRQTPTKGEKELLKKMLAENFESILTEIEQTRFLANDQKLTDFITEKREDITRIATFDGVIALQKELESALQILTSPEIKALRATLKRLNNDNLNFFSTKGTIKAQHIEQAMIQVPINERNQIVSGNSREIINLQEALAEHRNYFSRCLHGKKKHDKQGRVEEQGTANAFKEFKTEIKKVIADESSKKAKPKKQT